MDMLREQEDFRYRWLERSIERMEEMRRAGQRDVSMQIGEVQRLLCKLLSMHHHCDNLEKMLAECAGFYQRAPLIVPKENLPEVKA